MRVFVLVLDSVGIGAAPDAADYGDAGSNTLAHTAQACNGIDLPYLQKLGLGNIPSVLPKPFPILGVTPAKQPQASWGAMREISRGKDTTTGHWEIAGILLDKPLHTFPAAYPSFPPSLVQNFEHLTGRKIIGNKAASGTAIIDELGREQLETGAFIAYTSADSVFQIAAHEEVIHLDELYEACKIARKLCDPLMVGRVIARPFLGKPGAFTRTINRRDFSLPPPGETILDRLFTAGIPVVTVGKLDDIFANRSITKAYHLETTKLAQDAFLEILHQKEHCFVFANFIDFDMLYGHRRDAGGYARALQQTDSFLAKAHDLLKEDDVLIITADHGNDPTFRGTDHTREYVPLLCLQKNATAKPLGVRQGFFDVAQSIAKYFNLAPMPHGKPFLEQMV